ncbi:MAG: anion transporter [Acidobacteria bacterium]|nr:anion transporter [Acidobacteriota bacterium]
MDSIVIAVFAFVYAGMMLGRIPCLALDRTGIALLGAIVLVAAGRIRPGDAWQSIDVSTIALLLGLMVISAQFRMGGFYARLTRRLGEMEASPKAFLAYLIACSGALSAVLANDIVCLAMTPVLIRICVRRRLNPVPFLLALACASNVGSAATLIGNPQNMLIGQALSLSFAGYLLDACVPVLLGLVAVWAVTGRRIEADWTGQSPADEAGAPPYNAWQTRKGFFVLGSLIAMFLFTSFPREIVALAAAGILLASRRMASRKFLGLVDWPLLVLFSGLFVVNSVLVSTGVLDAVLEALERFGVDAVQPGWLFGITAVLSNLVSNVPATMLLLPAARHPMSGAVLALSSTLAGNLIIVGSIANIIVVEQARLCGITVTWKEHAKVGIPVTLLTLIPAAAWLWLRS